LWDYPCLWKEVVLIGVTALHFHEVAGKVVLSGDHVDAWVLIDLLVWFHFSQEVGSDA